MLCSEGVDRHAGAIGITVQVLDVDDQAWASCDVHGNERRDVPQVGQCCATAGSPGDLPCETTALGGYHSADFELARWAL
jgi:hypothetical protein